MNILRNEKGFALAVVLILAAIALGLTLAMLAMVGRGSYVSGQQKRYRTALEASRGGAEAALELIASGGNLTTPYANLHLNSGTVPTKLSNPTAAWGGLDNAMAINTNDNTTYDMTIDLASYRVYSKIVDTVAGNSAVNEGLLKSGVVTTSSAEVVAISVPYLYTIEVLSQSQNNPTERAKLSVLYQY
jgi:hypothetical protein